jgi:hypothetical protein
MSCTSLPGRALEALIVLVAIHLESALLFVSGQADAPVDGEV